MKRKMMYAVLAAALTASLASGCGNSAYKEAYDEVQQQVDEEAEKMQAEIDRQAKEILEGNAPAAEEKPETEQEQAEPEETDVEPEEQEAAAEPEPEEPEQQDDGETESEEEEPFVEKYKRDIVVSSEMLLKRFISDYKIPLATQLWTLALFDEDGAVAATTAVTNESTGETQNAFVVLTPTMDDDKMTGATPHFVMVGGTVYGDDGYCDDFMANIQEAMDNLGE